MDGDDSVVLIMYLQHISIYLAIVRLSFQCSDFVIFVKISTKKGEPFSPPALFM